MITKELFKKVRKLEVRTRGLVNNIFGGEYQSAFKGRGMVFSEVRQYQYGDDIRQIDWNVTARTGEPYIKIFEEEREQTLMLCVDISPSGLFGSHNQRKMDLAIEVCAVLAFSAIKNSDKVGLILFSDQVEKVVLPKKGKTHVLRIIRELFTTRPTGRGTDIDEALSYLNKILSRRAIVLLVSDFQDEDYEHTLRITKRKHDLVSLQTVDPLEIDLPDMGIVPFRDAETGELQLVDTSSRKVREELAERKKKEQQTLQNRLKRMQVDNVTLYTNQSYVQPLMSFFKRRVQRY